MSAHLGTLSSVCLWMKLHKKFSQLEIVAGLLASRWRRETFAYTINQTSFLPRSENLILSRSWRSSSWPDKANLISHLSMAPGYGAWAGISSAFRRQWFEMAAAAAVIHYLILKTKAKQGVACYGFIRLFVAWCPFLMACMSEANVHTNLLPRRAAIKPDLLAFT